VTKANVTINFDNTDKDRSPEQYLRYDNISVRREIRFDGTSKYTVNGTKCNQDRVKQLFMLVGLNVNNASFIIMQGHITKVVNMKPKDTLRQIEEAAHISMYETHKQKALALVAKKDSKLEEIRKIIDLEIDPKIEQLKVDREEYYLWKQSYDEMQEIEKEIAVYRYKESKQSLETDGNKEAHLRT
jgi:structural maintenance of chromosome 2